MKSLASDIKGFLLAGKAIFTVTSKGSGVRFTYKVQQKKGSKTGPWFVSVLTGQDNENDYRFFGTIFDDQFDPRTNMVSAGCFRHSARNAKVSESAPSAQGFAWLWRNIDSPDRMEQVDICHCGFCGRCGRRLTVPSSVSSGYGPECINFV